MNLPPSAEPTLWNPNVNRPASTAGSVNAYNCDTCKVTMMVIHVHDGVTPSRKACYNCEAPAWSTGYPSKNDLPMALVKDKRWFEWFKPTQEEIDATTNPEARAYYMNGGLDWRPITAEGIKLFPTRLQQYVTGIPPEEEDG